MQFGPWTQLSAGLNGDRPCSQVLVYNFADLRLLHSIETLSNLSGLMASMPAKCASSQLLSCIDVLPSGLHPLRDATITD